MNDLVHLNGKSALTTSLIVAGRFGKQHKNVLRDIEQLRSVIPDPDYHRLNFEPVLYLDTGGQGSNGNSRCTQSPATALRCSRWASRAGKPWPGN